MKPLPNRRCPPLPTHGFALVAAVFLIAILAALAIFIAVMTTHQQAGHMADVLGLRAYQAARAGIEWGAFDLRRNANCTAPVSFSPGGGLAAFTVTVQCLRGETATVNNEENIGDGVGTNYLVRRIVAVACNQPAGGACPNPVPGNNYVERQLSAVVGR